jgi:hypothetical protein
VLNVRWCFPCAAKKVNCFFCFLFFFFSLIEFCHTTVQLVVC